MDAELVQEQARRLGFDLCLEFDPALLVPEERIRGYCLENRCGSYDANHMCPPRVGSLEEVEAALQGFPQGVLLQYSRQMDVANDREGVIRTKLEFHRLILRLERRLKKKGRDSGLGPDRGKLRVVPNLHGGGRQAMPASGEGQDFTGGDRSGCGGTSGEAGA